MIVTSEDAREALETLTGSRVPSLMDLDDRTYDFYRSFLEPLLKNQAPQFALVTVNEKILALPHNAPVEELRKAGVQGFPTHIYPSGAPIEYTMESATETMVVCAACAAKMDTTEEWEATWYNTADWYECEKCGKWSRLLEEFYES
jgi:hypothetical protein